MDKTTILSIDELLRIPEYLKGVDLLKLCKVSRQYRLIFYQATFWDQAIAKERGRRSRHWSYTGERHDPEIIRLSMTNQIPYTLEVPRTS